MKRRTPWHEDDRVFAADLRPEANGCVCAGNFADVL